MMKKISLAIVIILIFICGFSGKTYASLGCNVSVNGKGEVQRRRRVYIRY